MQKSSLRSFPLVILICLAFSISGCQQVATQPASAPVSSLVWQVQVLKSEIKDNLSSVESVTQYNGSKIDEKHTQSPKDGFVYLIIDTTIRKTNNQSAASFDWKLLSIKDASGNAYQRMANDSFLEQYEYTPRITGLELRLGEYTGWMCFEIPASVASGQLSLAYNDQESQQEIVLQK